MFIQLMSELIDHATYYAKTMLRNTCRFVSFCMESIYIRTLIKSGRFQYQNKGMCL